MKRKLNWHPSRPDWRDRKFKPTLKLQELPPVVDMRGVYKRIFDQGEIGSCTANAASGLVSFQRTQQGETGYHASRLFIYYNERVIEGTVKSDAGAFVRDSIKVLHHQGACREHKWTYENDFRAKPDADCYSQASNFKIKEYLSINNANINEIKSSLAEGHGVIFGFTVYESFDSDAVAKTGIVPMPQKSEKSLGGHCVWLHGYNDEKQLFTARNSWGKSWGDKGNFYMPYQYLTNRDLASDFWTIKLV